jgi:hypothetical protein
LKHEISPKTKTQFTSIAVTASPTHGFVILSQVISVWDLKTIALNTISYLSLENDSRM